MAYKALNGNKHLLPHITLITVLKNRGEKTMKKEKIIQIIPAPSNLYAIYHDGDDPKHPMECKVVCFGLTDHGNVVPMDMDDEGYIEDITKVSNLIQVKRV